jgi:hypothetical protein
MGAIGSRLVRPMFEVLQLPHRARQILFAPMLALALLTLTAGAALGRVPEAPEGAATAVKTPTGYDISYPQCGSSYPRNIAFGIVGVTRGIVFSANPCLGAGGTGASQLAWAGHKAGLYMNTGNPGPKLSSRWPIGQTSPRQCGTAASPGTDTANCAYDYGWNSATSAYATAVKAYVSLGWAPSGSTRTPVANRWWLDVETANSWRTNVSLNVAALRGAADYLKSVGAASVGLYSAGTMWTQITGGTTAFAAYPSWVAGASTLRSAKENCSLPAFTGGSVAFAQYFASGFDADYPC